jgi:catechol 2,3-dioxygenase-like lactoylglutathione lyase family enzyme
MKTSTFSVVVFVSDIEVSKKFYTELLDQQVVMDHGPALLFKDGLSLWEIDHANKSINEIEKTVDQPSGKKTMELYFEVLDFEDTWEKIKDYGVEFVHKIKEHTWGQRVFRFLDPDKHMVEIGESLEAVVWRFEDDGMDHDAIVKKTSLPIETVKLMSEQRK